MPVEIGDTCKKGHVILGDNIQKYMNQGRLRVRCKICNQPPKNPPKKRGDKCKNGHVIDGNNLGEKLQFGQIHLYCKICARNSTRKSARKKASSSTLREQRAEQSQIKAADKADRLIEAGKEDQGLAYLRLNKRAERAAETLQKHLADKEPNCHENPGPYMDYDEDHPPTRLQAYVMCEGCPVLLECSRFANAYRPPMGVWGGEVYVNGKPLID